MPGTPAALQGRRPGLRRAVETSSSAAKTSSPHRARRGAGSRPDRIGPRSFRRGRRERSSALRSAPRAAGTRAAQEIPARIAIKVLTGTMGSRQSAAGGGIGQEVRGARSRGSAVAWRGEKLRSQRFFENRADKLFTRVRCVAATTIVFAAEGRGRFTHPGANGSGKGLGVGGAGRTSAMTGCDAMQTRRNNYASGPNEANPPKWRRADD